MKLAAITLTLLAATLLFGCLGGTTPSSTATPTLAASATPTLSPGGDATATPSASVQPSPTTEEEEIEQALEEGSAEPEDGSAQELEEIAG